MRLFTATAKNKLARVLKICRMLATSRRSQMIAAVAVVTAVMAVMAAVAPATYHQQR